MPIARLNACLAGMLLAKLKTLKGAHFGGRIGNAVLTRGVPNAVTVTHQLHATGEIREGSWCG